ncbi:MAG: rok family protein [Parcubacteria group bacterium Gr01-1014_33]|nr:MAG: rok family protein [Parcubacteria group bacterium Gr01-1014_33]
MNYFLGIDIGGTTIKAVLMRDLRDTRPRGFSIDTPRNKKEFLSALHWLVESMLGKSDFPRKSDFQNFQKSDLQGIGVGLPGIIDSQREVLLRARNLPFLNGWKPKEFFKKFSALVKIENDVNCFILAEHTRGAAKGYKNVVGIAIGTGIGGGIIIGGKLYRGSHGAAGEVGHTTLGIMNPELGIMKEYEFEELGAKEAFKKLGDRSEIIGIGVANLIHIFDPDIVVLGGGGITSGGIKLGVVQKIAQKHIISPLKKTPIVKGALGEYAQAIGAALLFEK